MTPGGLKSLTVSKPKNDLPTADVRARNIFPILSSVTLFSLLTSCLTASVLDVVRDNSGSSVDPDGTVRRAVSAESAHAPEIILCSNVSDINYDTVILVRGFCKNKSTDICDTSLRWRIIAYIIILNVTLESRCSDTHSRSQFAVYLPE